MCIGKVSVGNGQARVHGGQALLQQETFRAPVPNETRHVHGYPKISRVVVPV